MFRDDGDEFARLKDFFVESPNILEKKKKTRYSNRQLSKLNTYLSRISKFFAVLYLDLLENNLGYCYHQ